MAEFQTTHQTAASIESIIRDAKQRLVLVSPYLQLSRAFFARMKDADEQGVKIIIIYGKDELKPTEKKKLLSLKNIALGFCDNLHAKCYYNEDNMIITSMNMYEYSEKNNREMGILIKSKEDPSVYKDAVREVQSIWRSSTRKEGKSFDYSQKPTTESKKDTKPTIVPDTKKSGAKDILMGVLSTILVGDKLTAYCIRCGDRVPFDRFHPLCDECYWVWSDYGNPNYTEHFCHSCGKQIKTTKSRPLCPSCFQKY
ncbi:phospholipase D-like domain-containing protein [Chloroflexota bacterium]